ncbi:MAG: hypothetical protein L3J71_15470 [Victivallaceae bacterium]|nr:hypothetical protein [Victivallaceae bacterium]
MPGIIGSDSFKDRIIKKFLLRNVADINSREQSLLAKINTLSIDEVIYITAVALKDQQLKPALNKKDKYVHGGKTVQKTGNNGKYCKKI